MNYLIQEILGYVEFYYHMVIYSTINIFTMGFLLINICVIGVYIFSIYLLKARIREIDQALDSIETSTALNKWNVLRVVEYAFLFSIPKARDKGYQEKIDILNQNFSSKYQRPFKILFGIILLQTTLLFSLLVIWLYIK